MKRGEAKATREVIAQAKLMSNVLFNMKQILSGKTDPQHIRSMDLAQEDFDRRLSELYEIKRGSKIS